MTYLCGKVEESPHFYYKYNVNEENRLCKLLWTDARSRIKYPRFGDVLAFNTTYRTNVYMKPFVILTSVNIYYQSTIFWCALLVDKIVETYIWIL